MSKAELFSEAVFGSLKLVAPIKLKPLITTTVSPGTKVPSPGNVKPVPTTPITTVRPTTTSTTRDPVTTTLKPSTTPQKPASTPSKPATTTTITLLEPITTTSRPTTTLLKTTEEKLTTTVRLNTTVSDSTITTGSTKVSTTEVSKAVPSCKLGVSSVPDAIGFGMEAESYVEFGVKKGKLDTKSQYEFSFYSLASDGLLFTVNMNSQYDYEALYLSNGEITYVFNAGSGAMLITTDATYNDGNWHKVVTRRAKTEGKQSSVVNKGDNISPVFSVVFLFENKLVINLFPFVAT